MYLLKNNLKVMRFRFLFPRSSRSDMIASAQASSSGGMGGMTGTWASASLPIRCIMPHISCLMSHISCLVSCVLCPVSRVACSCFIPPKNVSCRAAHASRRVSRVACHMFHIPYLMCVYHVARLMYCVSRLRLLLGVLEYVGVA